MFSVIIPGHNEQHYIGACLASIAGQHGLPDGHAIEVIVAANGCDDATAGVARAFESRLAAKGFALRVLDLASPGKALAINAGEAVAAYEARLYLDADVILSPGILAALLPDLASAAPVFCSGQVRCHCDNSFFARAYSRVWSRLPFVADGVPGVGLYGVSASGRQRWGDFPQVQSDDRFVRLQFAPGERRKVADEYHWPVPQGLWNLIQVRRRWIEGNIELFHRFPSLRRHDDKKTARSAMLAVCLEMPLDFPVFVVIWAVSYMLARQKDPMAPVAWRRGRP